MQNYETTPHLPTKAMQTKVLQFYQYSLSRRTLIVEERYQLDLGVTMRLLTNHLGEDQATLGGSGEPYHIARPFSAG